MLLIILIVLIAVIAVPVVTLYVQFKNISYIPSVSIDRPDADVMPEYPGGMAECMEFVSKNLRYPEAALQKRIEGWVLVSFTVGVDGTITDVETLKGVYEALDEEAMRVVRLMPKWKPCEWYGKRVPMKFTMPIEFRLKKRK